MDVLDGRMEGWMDGWTDGVGWDGDAWMADGCAGGCVVGGSHARGT